MGDFIELVEFKMERNASARRRAMRVRQQKIERLLRILYRLVVVAALLMVMAGAGVIDAGQTITVEFTGVLMMIGGFLVIGVSAALFSGGEE